MKKIISISLGSSKQDYEFDTKFLDEEFTIKRVGTNGDENLAWEQLQRLQTKCDVMGIGMVSDNYAIGQKYFENEETKKLTSVVTYVPVTTGERVRNLLQCAAVKHVQKKLKNYFNNNKVLFLSGLSNYEMVHVMNEYTPNLKFADMVISAGIPLCFSSVSAVERFALIKDKVKSINPFTPLTKLAPVQTLINHKLRKEMKEAHVIVGTCTEILNYGDRESLSGKTLITSCVTDSHMEDFKLANVNLVIDVSPHLFDRPIGMNILEALIIGASDVDSEDLSLEDMAEIIKELDIKPRLLHPTGEFRDIRRFAFVIHPLSRENFANVIPINRSFLTDKVLNFIEKVFAYSPPFIYSEMKNIKSPTGAEAEGWLISVGGTPKEMLAHSPEFTYRRLLAASRMAEKLGAQIMGLGAFTKVVGDAGITVAKRSRLPITSGNSYSSSGALWAAADAMRRMKLIDESKDGKKLKAKTMVIGATGSIGSVSARLLAMAFDEVYIAGRNIKTLEKLKKSMLEDTPDAKIICTTDYDDHLHDMDMIVTSTSGAGKKILDITRVKPGCVITDVARPLDLPANEVAKRPDVLVIESGEILLPVIGKLHMKTLMLPQDVVFACLAETIVLALEGRPEVFTIGRNTEWEKVKEIYKLGLKHGMKLAAISGVNGPYSDEDIAKVRELALEARKTWQVPAVEEATDKRKELAESNDAACALNESVTSASKDEPTQSGAAMIQAEFDPYKEGSKQLKAGYKYVGEGFIEEIETGKKVHKSSFE